ncbi:hypothetical protein DQ04_09651000, partial [Trypanosoma grayi]|uniref:hypothetical protein n=1 Tax=Trypanosoma grayi TaxID=71804 RepID=UPI0004F42C4B
MRRKKHHTNVKSSWPQIGAHNSQEPIGPPCELEMRLEEGNSSAAMPLLRRLPVTPPGELPAARQATAAATQRQRHCARCEEQGVGGSSTTDLFHFERRACSQPPSQGEAAIDPIANHSAGTKQAQSADKDTNEAAVRSPK